MGASLWHIGPLKPLVFPQCQSHLFLRDGGGYAAVVTFPTTYVPRVPILPIPVLLGVLYSHGYVRQIQECPWQEPL